MLARIDAEPVRAGRRRPRPAGAQEDQGGQSRARSRPRWRRSSRRPSRSPAGSSAWSPGPAPTSTGIATLRKALEAEGALLRVIAPHGGQLTKGSSVEIVERTFATGRSIEFDAIVVADGAPKDGDFRALVMLQEAFRHLKAVGAWGDGVEVLRGRRHRPAAPGRAGREEGRRQDGRRHWSPPSACTAPGTGTPLVAASVVPPTV